MTLNFNRLVEVVNTHAKLHQAKCGWFMSYHVNRENTYSDDAENNTTVASACSNN